MRIFKYELSITATQELRLPKGATILKFDNQAECPVLWALVDPTESEEVRHFSFFGTGHLLPAEGLIYIGSALLVGGEFVWHLFEETKGG